MDKNVYSILEKYVPSRIAEQIKSVLQEALRLEAIPIEENLIPVGTSKLGGLPDLPRMFEWPSWNGKPLGFITQINLAELPKFDFLKTLPLSGLLSFFYSAEQETWGFYPSDKGSWKVVFFTEVSNLERRNFPLNLTGDGKYKSCSLKFHHSITFPPWESTSIQELSLTREEEDHYFEFGEKLQEYLREDTEFVHRLLGYPIQIQGDMQIQCQLLSNGWNTGDPETYRNPLAKKLYERANDWQLLLQIDSDQAAGMTWGDVGRIYYWIRKEDLQAANFDSTWMILQCS
mgnify:CR=1 FL=1